MEIIPVQTKIITPEDDLLRVIGDFAGPLLQSGDTLAISESVVAIAQGRIVRPEEVCLSFWARLISRFVHPDGSLSSPFAMQVVMEQTGTSRVVAAFCLAALTRLFGRRGDFYRLAGAQAALVDDITGTMPPFDKHIVLGPANPQQVVEDVKRRFRVEAAIIDANDLGRSQVLAATAGVSQEMLLKLFGGNPAGNADQQTPLVIVRKLPPPAPPATSPKRNTGKRDSRVTFSGRPSPTPPPAAAPHGSGH
jgi:F420-0:gamma-glutamyl ligase